MTGNILTLLSALTLLVLGTTRIEYETGDVEYHFGVVPILFGILLCFKVWGAAWLQ